MNHIINIPHAIVDIFAGGRSSIKLFLFIIFLLILILVARFKKLTLKSNKILLGISLLLFSTFTSGLLSWAFLAKKFGLSALDFLIVNNGSEISSSSLLHNQTLKGSFGLFLKQLGLSVQPNIDTGASYLGIIPNWVFILTLILASMLLFWVILYGQVRANEYSGKQRIAFLLLYAVFLFSLLKNIFDGGLLNREVPVALFALILLLGKDKAWLRWLSCSIILIYLLFIILFHSYGFIGTNEFQYFLGSYLLYILFAIGLLLWFFASGNLRPWLIRSAILLVVATSVFSWWQKSLLDDIIKFTLVPGQSAYIGIVEEQKAAGLHQLGVYGGYGIYKYTTEKPVSIDALRKKYYLMMNVAPIQVPQLNCNPEKYHKISFILFTDNLTSTKLESDFFLGSIDLIYKGSHSNGWYKHYVIVTISDCTPRPLDFITGAVRSTGVQKMIIANPATYLKIQP